MYNKSDKTLYKMCNDNKCIEASSWFLGKIAFYLKEPHSNKNISVDKHGCTNRSFD